MKRIWIAIYLLSFVLSSCAQENLAQVEQAPASQAQASQVEAPLPAAQATATPTQVAVSNVTVETPTQEAPETASGGLCSHPYYPVIDGATWVYEIGGDSQAVHTMSVEEEGKFQVAVVGGESTSILEGLCTEKGIVLMDRGMEGSFFTSTGSASTTSLSQDGVTLPNKMQVGDNWTQTFDMVGEGDDSEVRLEAKIINNYNVVGKGSVTVPAGTFEALKIEQNGTLTMSGYEFTTHGTLWYVEGIGNVQAENGIGNGEMQLVQLVSYNFP